MTRKLAWEAVFRIRLSHGFTQVESFGNIQIKNKTVDLVLCPTIDNDRCYAYTFENDSKADEADQSGRLQRINKNFLFVQSALLYSSSEGQRRIRCHNIAIPLTNSVSEAYDFIDITATAFYLTRKALARFEKVANIETTRAVIEAAINNMCKANQRAAVR